jgi:hypothetical protein
MRKRRKTRFEGPRSYVERLPSGLAVHRAKQIATSICSATGMSMENALDEVAEAEGFGSWALAMEAMRKEASEAPFPRP